MLVFCTVNMPTVDSSNLVNDYKQCYCLIDFQYQCHFIAHFSAVHFKCQYNLLWVTLLLSVPLPNISLEITTGVCILH